MRNRILDPERPAGLHRHLFTVLATTLATLGLAACQPPDAGRRGAFGAAGGSTMETEAQQASYAIGLNFGRQLVPAADHIDMNAMREGLRDGMTEAEPRLSAQEIQEVMTAFNETLTSEMQARQEEAGAVNREEGRAFLAENAEREEVVETESGLQYEVVEEGDGASPGPDDRIRIHYRGTLLDGTEFDSSYERGEPAEFGVSQVIPGFGEGLQLMSVGSHYRLYIPSDLAYGTRGSPPAIGPDATLIFEVELLEIL